MYGSAWQNHQKEFEAIPAPILFTTNCHMSSKASCKDWGFTTEVVSYPEAVHVGEYGTGGYSEYLQFTGTSGCDGVHFGRNSCTEFVKNTPKDTVVMTLACGKFRFDDLDLGAIGGLPRFMDIGQWNDACSAIKNALAHTDAFECV